MRNNKCVLQTLWLKINKSKIKWKINETQKTRRLRMGKRNV